jgi:hypothetical protein
LLRVFYKFGIGDKRMKNEYDLGLEQWLAGVRVNIWASLGLPKIWQYEILTRNMRLLELMKFQSLKNNTTPIDRLMEYNNIRRQTNERN